MADDTNSLTVARADAIYWNQMVQLAAEAVQLTPGTLGNEMSMRDALTNGNHFERTDPETGQRQEFGALRMTDTQAKDFLKKFEILAVQPNTASGLAAIAVRDTLTGQISVAYRSTESRPAEYGGNAEQDIQANQQIGNSGFAMAQIHDADTFLGSVAATYRQDDTAAPIKLIGYSLSGNIVRTQATTHPGLVSQSNTIEDGNMAFNATGLGNVGKGTPADVMNTYNRVLADPWSASLEALPYTSNDPQLQQLKDLQSEAIRVRSGAASNRPTSLPKASMTTPRRSSPTNTPACFTRPATAATSSPDKPEWTRPLQEP